MYYIWQGGIFIVSLRFITYYVMMYEHTIQHKCCVITIARWARLWACSNIFQPLNADGISVPGKLIQLNREFISRTFQKSGEKESLVARGKMWTVTLLLLCCCIIITLTSYCHQPSSVTPAYARSLVNENLKHDDTFNFNIKPSSFKCLLKHVPSCIFITAEYTVRK